MGKRKRANALLASPGVLDDVPAAGRTLAKENNGEEEVEEGEIDGAPPAKRRADDGNQLDDEDAAVAADLQARYDLATKREKRRLMKKEAKKEAQRAELPQIVIQRDRMTQGSLKIKELQSLVLWVLADGVNPPLFLVKQKHLVERVVVHLACGIDHRHLEVMPRIKERFTSWSLTQAPGERMRIFHPEAAFLQCALPAEARKAKHGEQPESPALLSRIETLNALLLSLDTMRANNYEVAEDRKAETAGYVDGGNSGPLTDSAHLLAIDCEMVITGRGFELARLSIVDEDMNVLYDSYVVPDAPVTDYNTRWSGITPSMLATTETTLTDARAALLALCTPSTILIGHSLENDLRALKLFYGRVIDTALAYHHSRGPPAKPALRWLAEKHLKQNIQSGDQGHDSIEDARTAMALIKLKLEKGLEFGRVKEETESLFKRLQRCERKSALCDIPTMTKTFSGEPVSLLVGHDDAQIASSARSALGSHHFIMTRFPDAERAQSNGESHEQVMKIAEALDEHIAELFDALPPRTLAVFMTGQGDMSEAKRLMTQQADSKRPASTTTFTEQDLVRLQEEIDKARRGHVGMVIKN